jgi:hypothetical protein
MRRLFLLLWLGCVCASGFVVQTQADITRNEPFVSQITSGDQQRYRFIAQDGEVLSIVARAIDGDVDPVIAILDLNDTRLMDNDDVAYPDHTDAIIEAFTAPYTGAYTLVVSAYGATAGAVEVTLLQGYSETALRDTFEMAGAWALADLDTPNAPQLSHSDGQLTLAQRGIAQPALAIGLQTTSDVYYTSTTITGIDGAQGWRVGLVFAYQDAQNYYQVLVNDQGAWRMSAVIDGESRLLRDWTPHPAIRAGQTAFTLGVLVNGAGFDVFYNNQYIGKERDNALTGGMVGLMINTANAIGSEVSARYDRIVVTRPARIDDDYIFPSQILTSNPNDIMRELEHRLLFPTGGTLIFNIGESFVQNISAGISRFPVGSQRATNFVVGADVSWQQTGDTLNGCGLVLRDVGQEDVYLLVYVDSAGGYGISARENDQFVANYFNTQLDLGQPPYRLVVIADAGRVHYYINGQHVHSLAYAVRDGDIGQAIINYQEMSTTCQYNNLWLWRLD